MVTIEQQQKIKTNLYNVKGNERRDDDTTMDRF